jgi:hypothetical protein
MPYPTGHRATVKKDIIDSARKLFNRHGFESVSLDQIMAGVGLTHGGFYSYFKSKSDLYGEVVGCFFTDPEWKSCWEGVHVDLSRTDDRRGQKIKQSDLLPHRFVSINRIPPSGWWRQATLARARRLRTSDGRSGRNDCQ